MIVPFTLKKKLVAIRGRNLDLKSIRVFKVTAVRVIENRSIEYTR